MQALGLRCVNCNQGYELKLIYQCQECGFPLEVVYSSPKPGEPIEAAENHGIWRYKACLPKIPNSAKVTLGEGCTPLLHARDLGDALGLPNLYIKNEGLNPTGSFKDRPTAVGVSMALSMGIDTVAVSSTGNAGASLAAYAARSKLSGLIFIGENTPPAKLVQMRLHGAKIVPVKGTLSDAFWLGYKASVAWNWMNITSTFLNPYTVEGDKTMAYELFRQLGFVPDWIVIPVSVGPLLVGTYKGYRELRDRQLTNRLPRMVAAQAARCSPIAKAFSDQVEEVSAWRAPTDTIAGGIADPLIGYEKDGTYTLRVVRESGGVATSSTDETILDSTYKLAQMEGIFSEPTGAVSVAALDQVRSAPNFSPDQIIVCVVTGHGLKQTSVFESKIELPEAIDPDIDALAEFLMH